MAKIDSSVNTPIKMDQSSPSTSTEPPPSSPPSNVTKAANRGIKSRKNTTASATSPKTTITKLDLRKIKTSETSPGRWSPSDEYNPGSSGDKLRRQVVTPRNDDGTPRTPRDMRILSALTPSSSPALSRNEDQGFPPPSEAAKN